MVWLCFKNNTHTHTHTRARTYIVKCILIKPNRISSCYNNFEVLQIECLVLCYIIKVMLFYISYYIVLYVKAFLYILYIYFFSVRSGNKPWWEFLLILTSAHSSSVIIMPVEAGQTNIHYTYCIIYDFYVMRIISCSTIERREILSFFIICWTIKTNHIWCASCVTWNASEVIFSWRKNVFSSD